MRTALGCLLALTLLTTGCGSEARSAGDDAEREIRDVAARYAEAQRANDTRAFCDELYAEELKRQLELLGGSCTAFVEDANRDPEYRLTVDAVRVHGDRALATGRAVERGERREEQLPLVREDREWRLTLRMPEVDRATLDRDQRAVVKAADRYSQLVRTRRPGYRFSVTEVEVKGERALVHGHQVYDGLFPPHELAFVREADGHWRLEPK